MDIPFGCQWYKPDSIHHIAQKLKDHAQEAKRLAESLSGVHGCPHAVVGRRRAGRVDAATYLGSGAVRQLAEKCATLQPER